MTGILLGILTFLGFFVLIARLPAWIIKLLLFKPLLTDIAAAILTYVLVASISSSITGLVASATLGLLTTGSLYVASHHLKLRKEAHAN